MNTPLLRLAAAALACAFGSCATNPLHHGYRPAAGVPKREWQNPNPAFHNPSRAGHDAAVNRYLSRGYRLIGSGSIDARYRIDSENARLLAIEKNADAAVFSSHYQGKRSERVAVPIATATSSGYSAYANNSNYRSQSQSGGQSTVYGYRDQTYELWNHKTTLLRKN